MELFVEPSIGLKAEIKTEVSEIYGSELTDPKLKLFCNIDLGLDGSIKIATFKPLVLSNYLKIKFVLFEKTLKE